jgi:nitronate monooxygenase
MSIPSISTLKTPVCELLGCDVPVVLAGMGGVARSELVAAVSAAGGFGFLGMVRESPALIQLHAHLSEMLRSHEVNIDRVKNAGL